MNIRTIESGLLMLLEAVRILEEDREPGKSRYYAHDASVWRKGEALVAIFSAGAAVELLLKQLLIDDGMDAASVLNKTLIDCIDQVSLNRTGQLNEQDRRFLHRLRRLRNDAAHSGSIDTMAARAIVGNVVQFVLNQLVSEGSLTESENNVYFRIRLTATEFTEYNEQLDRTTSQKIKDFRQKEFLWVCMVCDHQAVRLKGQHGTCLRCGFRNYGFGSFVDEVLNREPLLFADRKYSISDDTTVCGLCGSFGGVDFEEVDGGNNRLHACANCGVQILACHAK